MAVGMLTSIGLTIASGVMGEAFNGGQIICLGLGSLHQDRADFRLEFARGLPQSIDFGDQCIRIFD
jgi:hypothetical protein